MDIRTWAQKILENLVNLNIKPVIELIKETNIIESDDSNIEQLISQLYDDEYAVKNLAESLQCFAQYKILFQKQESQLKAFSLYENAIKWFMIFYQSNWITGRWSVPLIEFFWISFKKLAFSAEKRYKELGEESKDVSESPMKLGKMGLENIFRASQMTIEEFPDSRKLAAFHAVVHMCEMHFREGRYRMCLR